MSSVRRSVAALAMVFVAVFVIAGLALPGVASAENVRFTITNQPFTQGVGTINGSFDYDADTDTVSNVLIRTNAGTDSAGNPTPGFTFTAMAVRYSDSILVMTDGTGAVGDHGLFTLALNGASWVYSATPITARFSDGTCTVSPCNTITGFRQTLTAQVTSERITPPTVSQVTPSEGPAVGGNSVTITGTNFVDVTAVNFGGTPATSFTVDSATQITAVVPPLGQELLGANTIGAEVSVTARFGTSSTAGSADDYRYVGVPQPPLITTVYDGSIYGLNQIEIAGGASGSTSVEVFVDDASIGTTSVDSGNGNWTLTSPVLTDGSHTVRAVAISAGGRSASSATVTFTVDTTAPSVPVITSPVSGSIQQGITTISGTGEANTFVNVYINDGTTPPDVGAQANVGPVQVPEGYYAIGGTEVDANGRWTLVRRTREVVPSAQAIGRDPQAVGETPVSLLAVGSDQAGNRSEPSAIVTLTTDSVVPVTPTVTSPAPGSTVTTATPTFTGTGEPGSLITVYVDGNEWGQTYVDQSGNWTDNGQQAAIKGPQAGPRA
ncbi:hypothetical protein GVN24_34870, partial [Rhizobium sp. CRIBSB]|nr:hypothetical protein [Rhizobium sp. CRIBSB]